MLMNEDIICISSIDWDFIWQGHQEIMTRLARNGNRVLFVENTGVRAPKLTDLGRIKRRLTNWKRGLHGIRKVEENLYVYSPLVIPFPYFRFARFVNKRIVFSVLFKWLKAIGFSEPIVWVFLPTGLSLDIISAVEPKVLIYYCIDSFQSSSKEAVRIKHTERLILKKADMAFVTSSELSDYCAQWNKNVHYFPFGVNIENFKNILCTPRKIPDDIGKVKKPVVGYVGGLHKWMDYDLLRFIADENKNISFVFCGPIQTDVSKIQNLSNVFLLGQKDQKSLPGYVAEFDVSIIPYRITEYTRNVYPTKLNEYLSMGKRVISTNLPEVIKFNKENNGIVQIAQSKEEFSDRVKEALSSRPDSGESEAAVKIAEKNSWTSRLEEMSLLIEEMASKKTRERDVLWKKNLRRIYKNANKRALPFAAFLFLMYLLVFHTPLVWLAGKPLEINDTPGKADVIVALGAGVGESGKAGQNYEERVGLAVSLYKEGYAKKILYSSGYHYIMREAEVMKSMAVSMGVDPKDIILDQTPVNSYEMIKNLDVIAGNNNWKKIIIVSSPYHMLRTKMLCDKNLKGRDIFYVPVENSRYYSKRGRVSPRHISGIAHEYISILYYKVKKYI